MSSRPARRLRAATAAASLAVCAVVGGCGSGDSAADPGPGASTSASPSDAAETGPSTPASSGAGTSVVMKMPRVQLTAPEGWTRTSKLASFILSTAAPDSGAILHLGDIDAVGTGEASLAEQARVAVSVGGYGKRTPKVLDPVTINGVECYHLAGKTSDVTYDEEFGTIHGGGDISIHFEFDAETPAAERQATIDAVLASVVWK